MFVSNPGNVTLSDYDTQTLTDKLNVDDILQSRDYFNQTDFDSTDGTSGFGAGNLASGAGGANVAQPLKSTYTKSDDFGQMHSYREGLWRGSLTGQSTGRKAMTARDAIGTASTKAERWEMICLETRVTAMPAERSFT